VHADRRSLTVTVSDNAASHVNVRISMLTRVPPLVSLPLLGVAIITFTISTSYVSFARCVKWSTLALFSYIPSAIFAKPDWAEGIYRTFVPELRWSSEYLTTIVAILARRSRRICFSGKLLTRWRRKRRRAAARVSRAVARHPRSWRTRKPT
jgi:hypothetical protein